MAVYTGKLQATRRTRQIGKCWTEAPNGLFRNRSLVDGVSVNIVVRPSRSVDVIVWTRLGFLVLVIAFAAFLSTEWIVEAANADPSYYQNNGWPKIVASVVGGSLVSLLGFYLNRKIDSRELVDPKTGERMLFTTGGGHTFFFIPMQYWGPIIVVFGFVMAFNKP